MHSGSEEISTYTELDTSYLALISLKSVIMTKTLKTMVKCSEGGEPIAAPIPLSTSKIVGPYATKSDVK